MNRISGQYVGEGYTYDYIVSVRGGGLRLYSQVCFADEDRNIVADDEPVDLTESIDAEQLRSWAETWGLGEEHGSPADCIVGDGETLVAHRLERNPEWENKA